MYKILRPIILTKIGNSSVKSWIRSWIQQEYLLTRISLYNSFITSNVIHHSYIHPFKHNATLFVDTVSVSPKPRRSTCSSCSSPLKTGFRFGAVTRNLHFQLPRRNFIQQHGSLHGCSRAIAAITSESSRAIVVDASATTISLVSLCDFRARARR